jgi:hypothetical protein
MTGSPSRCRRPARVQRAAGHVADVSTGHTRCTDLFPHWLALDIQNRISVETSARCGPRMGTSSIMEGARASVRCARGWLSHASTRPTAIAVPPAAIAPIPSPCSTSARPERSTNARHSSPAPTAATVAPAAWSRAPASGRQPRAVARRRVPPPAARARELLVGAQVLAQILEHQRQVPLNVGVAPQRQGLLVQLQRLPHSSCWCLSRACANSACAHCRASAGACRYHGSSPVRTTSARAAGSASTSASAASPAAATVRIRKYRVGDSIAPPCSRVLLGARSYGPSQPPSTDAADAGASGSLRAAMVLNDCWAGRGYT